MTFILIIMGASLLVLAGGSDLIAWLRRRTLTAAGIKLNYSSKDDAEFFVQLSRFLTDRFSHGLARFSPASNYLCWMLARFLPPLRSIQNSADLFRYADVAFCSQIAQAFVDIATQAGRTARIVALNGHVVAEAYYDERWHAFDPDYGVIPRAGNHVMSVAELVASPDLAAGAYSNHRLDNDSSEVLEIYRRGAMTELPPGTHLSPRAARLQRILFYAKYALPVALFAIALLLESTGR